MRRFFRRRFNSDSRFSRRPPYRIALPAALSAFFPLFSAGLSLLTGVIGAQAAVLPFRTVEPLNSNFVFAPLSARVTIGGRVMVNLDEVLPNARVTVTDAQGNRTSYITSKTGSFRFASLASGNTYIITVAAKRYIFASRVITPFEDTPT